MLSRTRFSHWPNDSTASVVSTISLEPEEFLERSIFSVLDFSTKEVLDVSIVFLYLLPMSKILIPDGDKIREARGRRTQEEIAAASNGAFSAALLSGYENDTYLPKPEKWPILARALGVDFEQIAKDISNDSGLAA